MGSGLISLKSAGSLCLGVDGAGNVVLDDCAAELQWTYAESKLSPQNSTNKCLDIDMHTGPPMQAQLYTCNNRFEDGANEKFVYDAATGQLASGMAGPPKGGQECLAVFA